ncbi:hypothetical protein [Tsukamurella serpentis]
MTGPQRAELLHLVAGSWFTHTWHTCLYTTAATLSAVLTFKLAIRYGGI